MALSLFVRAEVYPRLCGGTAISALERFTMRGLSPPVRGNRFRRGGGAGWYGSIPACAGEPGGCRPAPPPLRVYPRLCGGTCPLSTPAYFSAGLSPPVRGNREHRHRSRPENRSIPACAGEPVAGMWAWAVVKVYPRLCGGTQDISIGGGRQPGLSPPVRGNRRMCQRPLQARGSIPACAGEPPAVGALAYGRGVYPRLCGGTRRMYQRPLQARGLSPPVRGNRRMCQRPLQARGSIPACAGEPPV